MPTLDDQLYDISVRIKQAKARHDDGALAVLKAQADRLLDAKYAREQGWA